MKRLTLAESCCTTRSAIGYWAGIFLLLYSGGLVLGLIWPAVRQFGNTLILTALGAACFLNFDRHRTLHCALTGPVFVLAAGVAALVEAGTWSIDLSAVWGIVAVAVGLAFIIEWRTVGRQQGIS